MTAAHVEQRAHDDARTAAKRVEAWLDDDEALPIPGHTEWGRRLYADLRALVTAADHADNARLRAEVAHLTDRLAVAQWVATRLRQQLDQATALRGQEPTTAWGDPRPSVAGGERW